MSLLRRFLRLGVEAEPDPPETPAEAAPDADDTPAPDESTLDDFIEATPAKPAEDATAAALRRAETAERELANERAARPARPATRDTQFDAEEQQLADARASGRDAEYMRWLQWQIDSNRNIRSAKSESSAALAEARDLADRTEFSRLALDNKKVYDRYKDRVEEVVQNARRNGQNAAPRTMILDYLLGQDMRTGKVKAKAPAAKPEPTATVDRGRSPTIRSDTRGGKTANSDREKRNERLKTTYI